MASRTDSVTVEHLAKSSLWKKVDRQPADECWLWTGAVTKAGYGKLIVGKRAGVEGAPVTYYAHRAAYALHHGELPPKGLHLDHLCHTPACCNPDHLEVVTSRLNTRRQWKPVQATRPRRMPDGSLGWGVRFYEYAADGSRDDRTIVFRDKGLADAVQQAIHDHRITAGSDVA